MKTERTSLNTKLNKFSSGNGAFIQKSMPETSEFVQVLKQAGFHSIDEYQEFSRQYTLALTDNGYGLRRSQLRAKDQIDFTPLMPANAKNETDYLNYPALYDEEYLEHLYKISEDKELSFCHAVPCFQDVVMKINKKRWLHVKTKEINIEEHTITMFIQDYAVNGVWTPGISGTGILSFDDESAAHLRQYDDVLNVADICDRYVGDMPWKDYQKEAYRKVNRHICKMFEDKLEKDGTDSFTELFAITIKFIGLANYMLTRERPKLVREPKEKKTAVSSPTPKTAPSEPKPRSIRTRTVGLVSFKSEKVPKAPDSQSVRHYKTAVWKAKGGIRHMKDGRIIPFKECVKHRKALQGKDQEPSPIPVKIRLSDNRPKD